MSVQGHLEAAAAYIAVAESADAKREAYAKAADEILAAMDEDPTLTKTEVGRRLGKVQSWVSELLSWRRREDDGLLPFSSKERQMRYVERKVPTRHEDRVEMAAKLVADPKVAKAVAEAITDPATKAGRLIAQQVHDREIAERRKRAEQERQSQIDKALPLPAYMAKMVEQMNEWSLGMAALTDDVADLPEGRGRELVAEAARNLAVQAQRWVEVLEPRTTDLGVIEGRLAS